VEDRREFFDSTSKAAVSASALSLRCSSRSSSLTRRRSSRASPAPVARGSPRPAIASCFQASSSAGYSACSRHQALRVASSSAAVAITACRRAAAVHRWLPAPDRSPDPSAKAFARQRSSVATLTPTSRDTTSIAELSGGNNRATIRSLYLCPYRATSVFLRPQRFRSYPGGNFSDTEGASSTNCCLGTGPHTQCQPNEPPDSRSARGKSIARGIKLSISRHSADDYERWPPSRRP
jgi:hypothetical protein